MKLRKLGVAIATVAMSCALFAGSASAADTWAACTAAQIGPYGDEVRVKVTGCNVDPTAGKNWMVLNSQGTDQMMATMLTAMSLGKPVAVAFDNANKSTSGYNIASALILSVE